MCERPSYVEGGGGAERRATPEKFQCDVTCPHLLWRQQSSPKRLYAAMKCHMCPEKIRRAGTPAPVSHTRQTRRCCVKGTPCQVWSDALTTASAHPSRSTSDDAGWKLFGFAFPISFSPENNSIYSLWVPWLKQKLMRTGGNSGCLMEVPSVFMAPLELGREDEITPIIAISSPSLPTSLCLSLPFLRPSLLAPHAQGFMSQITRRIFICLILYFLGPLLHLLCKISKNKKN